jgi:hypothetical protein
LRVANPSCPLRALRENPRAPLDPQGNKGYTPPVEQAVNADDTGSGASLGPDLFHRSPRITMTNPKTGGDNRTARNQKM